MKSVRQADVKNKRALLRADFNVALDEKGNILNDFRIRQVIPTIDYLIKEGAKIVILSRLGRPLEKPSAQRHRYSLKLIALRLQKLLNKEVKFLPDLIIGKKVEQEIGASKPEQIILLENLRFYKEEINNDPKFAQKLAKLGDIYIIDAFGECHRNLASIVQTPKYLSSVAGLLLEKEIQTLRKVLDRTQRPLLVIIGGAKISTKIKFIQQFLQKADDVLLGGALANTVLHAQGIAVGKSLIEEAMVPEVKELKITNTKLHLPIDALTSADRTGQAPVRTGPVAKTAKDELILDIGPDTRALFSQIITRAKTIIWNGPMGVFETAKFAQGTAAIAQAISQSQAFSVVGGGETVSYLEKAGLIDKFSHVSTGGGAMLKFLTGEKLPGLEALNYNANMLMTC